MKQLVLTLKQLNLVGSFVAQYLGRMIQQGGEVKTPSPLKSLLWDLFGRGST